MWWDESLIIKKDFLFPLFILISFNSESTSVLYFNLLQFGQPYISPTPFRESIPLTSNPHAHILSYLLIQVRHLPTTTTIDLPKQKSLSFEPFLLYHTHRSNALWPSLYGITISRHCFLDFPLFFHLTQIADSSVHTHPICVKKKDGASATT